MDEKEFIILGWSLKDFIDGSKILAIILYAFFIVLGIPVIVFLFASTNHIILASISCIIYGVILMGYVGGGGISN